VDPVPDPLLLRKSGSAGDRTRDLCICSQKLWPLDHRGGPLVQYVTLNLRYQSFQIPSVFIVRLSFLFFWTRSWSVIAALKTSEIPCSNSAEQDSQSTYNVTWYRGLFVQPLLQWKSNVLNRSESVFVALDIPLALRMRDIVVCGLSDSTIFFHIIS